MKGRFSKSPERLQIRKGKGFSLLNSKEGCWLAIERFDCEFFEIRECRTRWDVKCAFRFVSSMHRLHEWFSKLGLLSGCQEKASLSTENSFRSDHNARFLGQWDFSIESTGIAIRLATERVWDGIPNVCWANKRIAKRNARGWRQQMPKMYRQKWKVIN